MTKNVENHEPLMVDKETPLGNITNKTRRNRNAREIRRK